MGYPLVCAIAVPVAAAAPLLLAMLVMVQRDLARERALRIEERAQWIARYRSMTDIVVGMTERSKGSLDRNSFLLEQVQADLREVVVFLRKVVRRG